MLTQRRRKTPRETRTNDQSREAEAQGSLPEKHADKEADGTRAGCHDGFATGNPSRDAARQEEEIFQASLRAHEQRIDRHQ